MSSLQETALLIAALVVGGVIGNLFGSTQNTALAHNRRMQENGRLRNGWMVMPGSFGRVALLLIVLVLVQLLAPALFEGNAKWLVSVGVILGYGWSLLKHLHQRAEERA